MHQGRGLECLAGPLVRQPVRRQLAQFFVDQRQKLFSGRPVACLDARQDRVTSPMAVNIRRGRAGMQKCRGASEGATW